MELRAAEVVVGLTRFSHWHLYGCVSGIGLAQAGLPDSHPSVCLHSRLYVYAACRCMFGFLRAGCLGLIKHFLTYYHARTQNPSVRSSGKMSGLRRLYVKGFQVILVASLKQLEEDVVVSLLKHESCN